MHIDAADFFIAAEDCSWRQKMQLNPSLVGMGNPNGRGPEFAWDAGKSGILKIIHDLVNNGSDTFVATIELKNRDITLLEAYIPRGVLTFKVAGLYCSLK